MKRKTYLIVPDSPYANQRIGSIDVDLLDGWILAPDIYDGKPLRTENAIVYHLVKYEEGEEPVAETEENDPIVMTVSVSHDPDEQRKWVDEGYVIPDKSFVYAKNAVMVLYQSQLRKENDA